MEPNDSQRTAAPATGKMGMGIFLAALGMLFAASMVAYLIVRARAQAWPPPGMPRLPAGLWVSTIILLISSATMHWALTSARRDRHATLCGAMLITTLLGVLFLVSQTVNWIYLLALHMTDTPNLYAFTFYTLTGLHALHVLGGLIPLAFVTARAYAGRYSSEYHPGVIYCSMYWHFLDVVWLVMFALMFLFA